MKKYRKFIKTHNLISRVYDMLHFFNDYKFNKIASNKIKSNIGRMLVNIESVESLAKYFESKLKIDANNIELKYNINNLIIDLDYLKQYLVK